MRQPQTIYAIYRPTAWCPQGICNTSIVLRSFRGRFTSLCVHTEHRRPIIRCFCIRSSLIRLLLYRPIQFPLRNFLCDSVMHRTWPKFWRNHVNSRGHWLDPVIFISEVCYYFSIFKSYRHVGLLLLSKFRFYNEKMLIKLCLIRRAAAHTQIECY